MIARPRRLRATAAMRRLVAETRVHPAELILPLFVREGATQPVPISSMPGPLRTIASWSPITTVADALRKLCGNPNAPARPGDPWSLLHPVAYSWIWIIAIITICAPLAVRAYQRSIDS